MRADEAAAARSVLVTGASSGIGAAIAERLAADGWTVIGLDRTASTAQRTMTVDLADAGGLAAAAAELPPVQALVHAAGFMRTGSLDALDVGDGDDMWAVHVRALTILAQALVPRMANGGRLLAIGSRTSGGVAGRSQYAACKAAVVALARSWALELAPRGITANVIAPAATATPMLADVGRASAPPVTPPIGRLIEPREVAAYAAFILSPEAAAITGQQLFICGGASL